MNHRFGHDFFKVAFENAATCCRERNWQGQMGLYDKSASYIGLEHLPWHILDAEA